MKKFLSILVLSAMLIVPAFALAAPCPDGQNACETGGVTAKCECGTIVAQEGEFCWTEGSRVFVDQIGCETAMAAGVTTGGIAPGGTGVPEGMCGSAMKHTIQGCTELDSCKKGEVCDIEACCMMDRVYTIADWFFVIMLVIAALFILWGAFDFITSQGDPDKLGGARNKLIWAIVGVIVAFLAFGLVRLVTQIIM